MNTRRVVAVGVGGIAAVGLAIGGYTLSVLGAPQDTVATQTFTNVVTYTIPTVTETVTVTQPPAPPPAPPPPPPPVGPPPPPPPNADYWVGPSGVDTNPGTYALPFRTIQHAADLVTAGQRVGVQDGTYTASGSSHCGQTTGVCVWRGGTSSAPVVFFAEHKWGAVIDGQHAIENGWTWTSGINYVTVDGFQVKALVTVGNHSVSGFELFNGGTGSKVLNCQIHDIGKTTSSSSNGFVGVFTEVPNVTVSGCWMYDIGRVNTVNLDHGVYLNAGNNDTITGNYFDSFLNGWAIQLYPGTETGTTITGNTFIGGKPTTSYTHVILGANITNATITGNVFWSANTSLTMSDYQGTFSGVTFSNNTATGPRWCDKTSACTTAGSLPPGFSGTGNMLNAQIPKPPPPQ